MNKLKRILGALLFCLTLNIGMIVLAQAGTVTVASAKIRANADTSATVLASVSQNQTVDIIGSTTGTDGNTWYQVWVDANTKGYIRSDLVNVSGTVSAVSNTQATTTNTTTSTTTSTVDTSTTNVTPVEAKAAYVTTDNVRIRKGASTNHGIVGTAKRGMAVTVNGEATGADSKKWYQIQFTYNNEVLTGFIRSDFITFEPIANEAAVSEITGGETTTETQPENTEGTEGTEASTEEQQPETTEEPVQEPEPATPVVQLLNSETAPYIMPGFKQIILTMNEIDYNAYSNGSFYLLYASYNGVTGWYIFDSSLGTYARYPYDVDAVATEDKSSKGVGVLPVAILVVICVIFAALSAFLFIKYREATMDFTDDDDDDDDDEEQRRAIINRQVRRRHSLADDLEDEDEEEKPARQERPVRKEENRRAPQGQQRPASSQRPQGQRPASTNGARPQSPSQRPSANQNAAQTSAARRQAQNQPQQRPQGQPMRRPQNPVEQPQRRVQKQEVQAKNFIETGDDGDIEFIDL